MDYVCTCPWFGLIVADTSDLFCRVLKRTAPTWTRSTSLRWK